MKKVLVADDKATGRELVRTVLEKADMRYSRPLTAPRLYASPASSNPT